MKQNVTQAIILHHSNYGESDRIVTFLTPDHGRLKGFARAARKSRKRFGAALESYAEVQMHWASRSSGDLVSLNGADLVKLHSGLRKDLETLTLAGYGCELTETFFDESGASAEVFALLQSFLGHLDNQGYSLETRLLMEIRVLSLAGYVPHLMHCAACFGPLEEGLVSFSAAADGSLCSACAGRRDTLKVDRMTLGTFGKILQTPLTHFADFKLSPRSRREGLALLADALRCHLPKPLKSLESLNRYAPQEPL